jgi:hypothetical protein
MMPKSPTIIDCATTGRGGDQLGRIISANTLLAALMLPRALRVVFGQRYLDETLSSTSTNTGTKILRDFIQIHERENQFKDLKVWNRVLDFEDVLYPENYVMEINPTLEAVTWYRSLGRKDVGAGSKKFTHLRSSAMPD